jgi:hypothetical protein
MPELQAERPWAHSALLQRLHKHIQGVCEGLNRDTVHKVSQDRPSRHQTPVVTSLPGQSDTDTQLSPFLVQVSYLVLDLCSGD